MPEIFPLKNLSEFGEAGETASLHDGCTIEEASTQGKFDGTFFHQCDTNPGSSGGPIFALFDDGKYYIVGLHAGNNELIGQVSISGGVMTDVINRGVQVSRWSWPALAQKLQQFSGE